MVFVVFGEVLVERIEECFPDVCCDFCIVGGVVPDDVSFSCPFGLFVFAGIVCEGCVVAAVLECFFVVFFGCVEIFRCGRDVR